MEKRINKKIENYIGNFKSDIKDKINEMGLNNIKDVNDLLKYIYDYDRLILNNEDFQKRKRVKTFVPIYDRCCARRANNDRCTRRKIEGNDYCGTHIKGAPNGKVMDEVNINNSEIEKELLKSEKIEVWCQDIKGIVYYIDKNFNVYDNIDIVLNSKNPRIIAKYVLDNDGNYSIPEFGI